MFQPRIVRSDDALLVFETLAFLIRQYGSPARPIVPSPLHKSQGIETLVHDASDGREVFDWAQDNYATVNDAMGLNPAEFRFIASLEPVPEAADLVTYDPRLCGEKGRFVADLVLDLCDKKLATFDPEFEPSPFQAAVILLSAAAYFRQGFVLTHLPEATRHALDHANTPQRFVENILTFAACVALCVNRQSPEQIVATYGTILPKHIRKKVPATCRQIESFEAEIKLLRLMSEQKQPRPRGRIRTELTAQPQRISWT